MNKIIIGIHGLSNKPKREVLRDYWFKALREGLENVGYSGKIPFESVFWADLLYKQQLHEDQAFDFDSLFNDEPYVQAKPGALRDYADSWIDEVRSRALAIGGDLLDSLKRHCDMNNLADWVLQKWLKDLAFYYDEKRILRTRDGSRLPASKVLQGELLSTFRKHKDKEILLIAHSMGSIISYDTLRNIGQSKAEADGGLWVPYFITIGSPLGLPHVKGQIIEERKYAGKNRAVRVRTPSIVTKSWVNFADPKDPVAADVHLRDDYQANASDVRVVDDLVDNDYQAPHKSVQKSGKRNHHKSYGYLRTPELSRHVKAFLERTA